MEPTKDAKPAPRTGPVVSEEERKALSDCGQRNVTDPSRLHKKAIQTSAERRAEVEALRQVAEVSNRTAQMAIQLCRRVLDGQLEVQRIDANGASMIIVKSPPDRELKDEICEALSQILKLPLVAVPNTFTFETCLPDVLEKAGFVKARGPLGLVGPDGAPLT